MSKIATRQYVANLAGDANGGTRCATFAWIRDNHNAVAVSAPYNDNRLVKKEDIYRVSSIILGPISGNYIHDNDLTNKLIRPFDMSKPFEISLTFRMNDIISDEDGVIFCLYSGSVRIIQLMWYTRDWNNEGITTPFVRGYINDVNNVSFNFMDPSTNIFPGGAYTFRLKYDGKAVESNFNYRTKITEAILTSHSNMRLMIAGSPHADNTGSCNIDIANFFIKN